MHSLRFVLPNNLLYGFNSTSKPITNDQPIEIFTPQKTPSKLTGGTSNIQAQTRLCQCKAQAYR